MKTCIIQVLDEVNIKILNLDLDVRKALVNKFKYEDPTARFRPAYRLGRWDGKVQYFQLGGSSYVNLLPEILPILDSYGYDVELVDNRQYSTNFKFDAVDESTYSHVKWPEGHPAEGEPIMLRDYQVDVINNFLENLQCLQEIATGSGKCLSGDTMLCVDIDENTPFGQFMKNKLQQEQENNVTRNNNKK